jgi:diguanylate cyclase (GGDEF)-like protein
VATIQDVTERKMGEYLERDRRRVLELVALDAPLERVLSKLATAVEFQLGNPAAVMALQDGVLALHAPSLQPDWLCAIEEDRLALASGLSTSVWADPTGCGVTNIATDQPWGKIRPLAQSKGYQSCWSYLLRSGDDAPNGLLLVFSSKIGRPTAAELQVLRTAGDLARICIDHHTTTRQLAHLVRHDPLTGLPNRVFFQDRLQQAITLAGRSKKPIALLALDVDHFKEVNDTLGHDAGDSILRQFSDRIRAQLRQTDTIARMGGDEFMIVLPELQDARGAVVVAEKLVECLREPFRVAGQDLHITTSIGIAAYPADGNDSATLQRRADEQMYKVKKAGRNNYSFCRRPD